MDMRMKIKIMRYNYSFLQITLNTKSKLIVKY